ncbi:hypothetical protein B0H19DRAFT_1233351 [Mycena capillaripes]|nr:hypothetical protein B0H19DRAFT_1233351 [Mycena capillaripes]
MLTLGEFPPAEHEDGIYQPSMLVLELPGPTRVFKPARTDETQARCVTVSIESVSTAEYTTPLIAICCDWTVARQTDIITGAYYKTSRRLPLRRTVKIIVSLIKRIPRPLTTFSQVGSGGPAEHRAPVAPRTAPPRISFLSSARTAPKWTLVRPEGCFTRTTEDRSDSYLELVSRDPASAMYPCLQARVVLQELRLSQYSAPAAAVEQRKDSSPPD